MMADEWKIQIAEVGVLYFFLISAGRGGRYTGGRAAVTTFLTSSGVLSGEEGDWRGWGYGEGKAAPPNTAGNSFSQLHAFYMYSRGKNSRIHARLVKF